MIELKGLALHVVTAPEMKKYLLLLLLVAALPVLSQPSKPTPLLALNSYLTAPYVMEGKPGLASLFVDTLNLHLPPSLRHVLDNVPRRRMTEGHLAREDFRGLALFLSPDFLPPHLRDRFQWSRPLFLDENVVISPRKTTFDQWSDFTGLTQGGIDGHIYEWMDPLRAAGKLHRDDAPDHHSNLAKLCLGRVNFIVMSQSEFRHTRRPDVCLQQLFVHPLPTSAVIERRVLVAGPAADVQAILRAVDQIACHVDWVREVKAQGLEPTRCTSDSD
jgi:polar amino acid transport system substrate-binding protein